MPKSYRAAIEILPGWRRVTRGLIKKGDFWLDVAHPHGNYRWPYWVNADIWSGIRKERFKPIVIRRGVSKP
jgi:hypothetical protein